jgi:hypothetical protein
MTEIDPGDDRSVAAAAEANEPDLIDQQVPVGPDRGTPDPPRRVNFDDPEIPEADALEQSIPVGRDGDDY